MFRGDLSNTEVAKRDLFYIDAKNSTIKLTKSVFIDYYTRASNKLTRVISEFFDVSVKELSKEKYTVQRYNKKLSKKH